MAGKKMAVDSQGRKIRKDGTLAGPIGRPRTQPAPDPNKIKYVKGVARPHTWHHQDPLKHQMHMPYLRSKAQARFRGEAWELTFDDYYELWRDHWEFRGRGLDDLIMSRQHENLAWSRDNCHIVTRRDHLRGYFNQHIKDKPRA